MPIWNAGLDIMSGLAQGLQMREMLNRSAREQQQLEMEADRNNRINQARDIDILTRLSTAGRPIQGGAVTDRVTAPNIGGIPKDMLGSVDVARKPDPARTVRYKAGDGQTREYELYSPDEQISREMQQRVETARALKGVDIETQQTLEALGLGPLSTRLKTMEVQQGYQTRRDSSERDWRTGEAEKGRKHQGSMQETRINASAKEGDLNRKARKQMNDADNVVADKRITAAEGRAVARENAQAEKAAAAEAKAAKAAANAIQARIDSLETQKRRLHQERVKAGQMATGIGQSKEKDDVRLKKIAVENARIAAADQGLQEIQQQQAELEERKRAIYGRTQTGSGGGGGGAKDSLGIR